MFMMFLLVLYLLAVVSPVKSHCYKEVVEMTLKSETLVFIPFKCFTRQTGEVHSRLVELLWATSTRHVYIWSS